MEPMRGYLTIGLVLVAFGLPAQAQVVNPYAPQYYRGGGRAYQRAPSPVNPYGGGQGSFYYQPAPQARGYYPGMRVQPPVEQHPGLILRRLFGYEEEKRRAATRAAPRIKPKPAAPVLTKQEKPKVDPSTHVVVFGDALADLTGQGLDDAFSDSPEVAVVRKPRADISLARDGAEWPKAILDILNGGQKITVAVMMLGSSERQSITEGETTHEPLSERWKQLYRDRVDAVVRTFQERGVPVVWIGVPPMRNAKLSADYVAMNEIYRESVERLGGSYVDIWPGFVDDENRYTPVGPDVDGQTVPAADQRRSALHPRGSPQGRPFRGCRNQASHRSQAHRHGGGGDARAWRACRGRGGRSDHQRCRAAARGPARHAARSCPEAGRRAGPAAHREARRVARRYADVRPSPARRGRRAPAAEDLA